MPVTASYRSCFLDVLSQRQQKKSRPSKKGVIWVQGHAPAGGEGGIRTLDELLTHTRVPVARQQFEDVLLLFRFILPYLMLSVNYFFVFLRCLDRSDSEFILFRRHRSHSRT